MKIKNAKDRDLEELSASLPDMSDSVRMFFQKMKVYTITKEQVDGYTVETKSCKITDAVKVPLSPETIAVKPEGQRSWKWYSLHCVTDLCLKTDDIVELSLKSYRVQSVSNYSEYGYFEYQIVEDYVDE